MKIIKGFFIVLTLVLSLNLVNINKPAYATCTGGDTAPGPCDVRTCPGECPYKVKTQLDESQCYCSDSQQYQGVSLGKIEGWGVLGEIINKIESPGHVDPAAGLLAQVISAAVGLITIVAGIWFMLQFLLGGFSWITSSGDKNKVQEAQHKITNSIIGLTIVVAAYAVANLISKILGIPYLLDIGSSIPLLKPR